MIKTYHFAAWFTALGIALSAHAQNVTDYSLNEGKIHFKAPTEWPMILQKNEGNPQFTAFQVKDPADINTGEASRVTVTTKLLGDAQHFQAFVDAGIDKAKQTPGYTPDTENKDHCSPHYTGLNGKTHYQYRETFFLNGTIGIHVRCLRPQLSATSKAWSEAYEKGCDQVMASVKPH